MQHTVWPEIISVYGSRNLPCSLFSCGASPQSPGIYFKMLGKATTTKTTATATTTKYQLHSTPSPLRLAAVQIPPPRKPAKW